MEEEESSTAQRWLERPRTDIPYMDGEEETVAEVPGLPPVTLPEPPSLWRLHLPRVSSWYSTSLPETGSTSSVSLAVSPVASRGPHPRKHLSAPPSFATDQSVGVK